MKVCLIIVNIEDSRTIGMKVCLSIVNIDDSKNNVNEIMFQSVNDGVFESVDREFPQGSTSPRSLCQNFDNYRL